MSTTDFAKECEIINDELKSNLDFNLEHGYDLYATLRYVLLNPHMTIGKIHIIHKLGSFSHGISKIRVESVNVNKNIAGVRITGEFFFSCVDSRT